MGRFKEREQRLLCTFVLHSLGSDSMKEDVSIEEVVERLYVLLSL